MQGDIRESIQVSLWRKIAKLSYTNPKTTSKPSVHRAPSVHRTHLGNLNNVLMDEFLEDE